MTKQNTKNTQKEKELDFFILSQEKNLDDFLLDGGWDDDDDGLALDGLTYGEDTDGWMGGI